jgi:dihydroxyacid dehydratase/phosphogluconate dehydratase
MNLVTWAYAHTVGLIVLEFGKIVKKAVEAQGMLGWQFNTVGVSDAITMGGEGEQFPNPFQVKFNNLVVFSTAFSIRNAFFPPNSRDHRR